MNFLIYRQHSLLRVYKALEKAPRRIIEYQKYNYAGLVFDCIADVFARVCSSLSGHSVDVLLLHPGGRFPVDPDEFCGVLRRIAGMDTLLVQSLCPVRDLLPRIHVENIAQQRQELLRIFATQTNYRIVADLRGGAQLRVYVLSIIDMQAFPSAIDDPHVQYVFAADDADAHVLEHLFAILRRADPAAFQGAAQSKLYLQPYLNVRARQFEQLAGQQQKDPGMHDTTAQQRTEIERLNHQIRELKENLRLKQTKLEHYKYYEDHQASRENLIAIEIGSQNAYLKAQNDKLVSENMRLSAENQRLYEKFRIMEDQAAWMERYYNMYRGTLEELRAYHNYFAAYYK